jgi:hypothetical protein
VYPGPSFFGIAVGDLDHNGKPDIVTASQTDGLITYMSSGCTPN